MNNEEEIVSLYKYSPISIYTLKALALNSIWSPKIETLNDPYDCRASIRGELSECLVEKELRKKFGSNASPTKEDIERVMAGAHEVMATLNNMICNMGVLSLSETNNSPTMWSHYADSHRGICLEFDRPSSELLQTSGIRVVYSGYKVIVAKDFLGFGSIELNNVTVDISRTKSKDWIYEKEWRVVTARGNMYLAFPGDLKSITFGMNSDIYDIMAVVNIVSKNNPDCVYRSAIRAEGKYEIDFRDEIDMLKKSRSFRRHRNLYINMLLSY